MKKEVALAIITGLIVGLLVSFGLYQARRIYLPTPEIESNQTEIVPELPVSENAGHMIEIASPADFSLTDTSSITISGTTTPDSYIAAVSSTSEVVGQANATGDFTLPYTLIEGVNIITLTAIGPTGEQADTDLTITYIVESNVEAADEN